MKREAKCKCGETFTQYLRNGIPSSKKCEKCRYTKPKTASIKQSNNPLKIEGNKLERLADKTFAQYIKEYYSLTRNGVKGCYCVTCNNFIEFPYVQLGHYIKRRHYAVRYHLLNVGPQCNDCNSTLGGDGRPKEFREYLVRHHGEEMINGIEMLSRQVFKINDLFYLEIIAKYKELLKNRKND